MEKYNICFDNNNPNAIVIRNKENNRIITAIACPPIDSGCDVISFGDTLYEGYTFNFGGFIIITTPEERKLYHEGILITEIKREKLA